MLKVWGVAGLVLWVAVVSAGPALATDGMPAFPKALKGMLGMWSISLDDDSVPSCIVKLRKATTIGGYQLDIAKDCPKNYPTDGVGAWNIGTGDEILFIDVLRHVVFRFQKVERGIYSTDPNNPPRYILMQPNM